MKLDLQVRHLNKRVARMDSAIEGTLGEPNYTLIGEDGNNVAAIINANVRVITPADGQRFSVMRALGELEGSGSEAALNALAWDIVHNATGTNSRVRGIFGVAKLRSTSSNAGLRGMQSVVKAEAGAQGDMTAVIGQIEPVSGMGQANAFQSTLNSDLSNFGTGIKIARATGATGSYAHGIILNDNGATYGTAAILLPDGALGGKILWAGGAYIRQPSSTYLEIATRLGINTTPETAIHAAISDAAGAGILTLSNLSSAASTAKVVQGIIKGRTTGAADVEVGKLAWVPRDNDWADSYLNFHFRRSGSLEEAMQLTSDIGDGETCMLIRRNVGSTFSLQRVSLGVTDSGGSGFKLLRVAN